MHLSLYIFQYTEQEKGRVVVYITTLGVIRNTHERCQSIRKVLENHSILCEKKDLFLSRETQIELQKRLRTRQIILPQVFLEGQYLGVSNL